MHAVVLTACFERLDTWPGCAAAELDRGLNQQPGRELLMTATERGERIARL